MEPVEKWCKCSPQLRTCSVHEVQIHYMVWCVAICCSFVFIYLEIANEIKFGFRIIVSKYAVTFALEIKLLEVWSFNSFQKRCRLFWHHVWSNFHDKWTYALKYISGSFTSKKKKRKENIVLGLQQTNKMTQISLMNCKLPFRASTIISLSVTMRPTL